MKLYDQTLRTDISYLTAMAVMCLGMLHTEQTLVYLCFCGLFLLISGYLQYADTKQSQLAASILLLIIYLFLCFLSTGFYIRLLIIPIAVWHLDLLPISILASAYVGVPFFITVLINVLQLSGSILHIITDLFFECLIEGLFYLVFFIIQVNRKNSKKLYEALSQTALSELREHSLNQKLALQNQLIDRNARLEERESMGRTIHNAVGHTITAAIVTLDAAEILSETDSSAAKEKILQAKERMQLSLSSIRQAVRLFDQNKDQLKLSDLYALIQASAAEFCMDTTIHVRTNLIAEETPEHIMIDHKTSEFLHGAVLEALSNGVRHGQATAFIIAANASHGQIRLTVMDNGHGSASDHPEQLVNGYGLKKIHSFVENAGGELGITQEDGFAITITLPFIISKEAVK